jgi:Na+-driven multidrug efflux pump
LPGSISICKTRRTTSRASSSLEFLTVAAVFQVFDGIQVIAAGALRGHRDTAVPLLIAAFGYWGIGFTGGWLLAFPLSCGPIGLWFGLAGGLAVVTGLLTLRLLIRSRTDVHKGTEPVAYGGGRTMMQPAVPVSDRVRGK